MPRNKVELGLYEPKVGEWEKRLFSIGDRVEKFQRFPLFVKLGHIAIINSVAVVDFKFH